MTDGEPLNFPYSRSGVSARATPPRDLGLTRMSLSVDRSGVGAKGHWCPNCKGIWYSYFLETTCPVCGRRG